MTTNTSTSEISNAPVSHGSTTDLPGTHPAGGPQKPRKRGFIWALLLLLVAAVAAYAVWRASQPGLAVVNPNAGGRRGAGRGAAGLGPTPVVVAKAKRAAVPVYLSGLGNVSAFYTVTVKSRVDGQLMSVGFKEGDFVKEGQVLAEIDPRPYQVQLEQAEGTLARDTALLSNARIDLDRYKTLLAQDAIPKQQLDTQVALVAQLEGTVKQDQATINNAKLQLIYAKVTAPISGKVGLRLVDPGNIVHAADAGGMLVITQLQPICALFTIPEDTLQPVLIKLNHGIHLTVEAWNRDNSKKIANGTLLTLDNQIDQTTGTSKLKAVFENKDDALFPNQFVNIRLLVDTQQNQIVSPSVALQHGQQGAFVFVVGDDSKVVITPVQPGIVLDDNTMSVLGGLEEGAQVVVDGTDRLQNASPVRIRKPGDDGMGNPNAGRGRGKGARGGKTGGAGQGGAGQGGGRAPGGPTQ
jgi:multidrug efflux system membrane fusion protein